MNKKEIEQQIKNFAEKIYQARYDDGYKDGAKSGYVTSYNEGLNDAWECTRRLISDSEVRDVFGDYTSDEIIENFSASEAIQKIKDYEESQKQADAEIRVGDEVCGIKKESRGVVTDICHDGCGYFTANVMMMSGKCASVDLSILYKTGKHYPQIAEVLKELRGDEE